LIRLEKNTSFQTRKHTHKFSPPWGGSPAQKLCSTKYAIKGRVNIFYKTLKKNHNSTLKKKKHFVQIVKFFFLWKSCWQSIFIIFFFFYFTNIFRLFFLFIGLRKWTFCNVLASKWKKKNHLIFINFSKQRSLTSN
jgi:hypothetical protein